MRPAKGSATLQKRAAELFASVLGKPKNRRELGSIRAGNTSTNNATRSARRWTLDAKRIEKLPRKKAGVLP
jgi:hypothetical protein